MKFFALAILFVHLPLAAQHEEEGVKILDQIDRLYFSNSAHMKMKLTVERQETVKEYELEWFSRGQSNVFIRFNSPEDSIGQKYLKVGKELWFFDPKEDRAVQISRTGALRRFLQSEFSRDDVLNINQLSEEYNVNLQKSEESWKLILTPKMITPIVWDKIVINIDKDSQSPITKEYYNERGAMYKKISYSKPVAIEGKMIPTILDIENFQYKGYRSRLEYKELTFDGPIEPRIFSMKVFENMIELPPPPGSEQNEASESGEEVELLDTSTPAADNSKNTIPKIDKAKLEPL